MNAPVESSNSRRSQRVALQMRVALEAEIDRGKPFRIDAFTLVVSAHGGLLELGLPLRAGQKLSIIHPFSGRKEGCKIVGVRCGHDTQFLVAFEFDSPAPNFWPVELPPVDWASARPGGC